MSGSNILLVLVDQWPALSFGHRGAAIDTPNTDRLAAEGTVFTNAFTSCTLCSPARGALLTARWAHQTGMYDNVGVGYSLQEPLRSDETTWIGAAAKAGYHVGYFGKWHLGPDGPIARGAHRHSESFDKWSRPYDPAGSDYSYASQVVRYREHLKRLERGNPPFWGVLDVPKEQTEPFRLAADAAGFLSEYANSPKQRPFFLTVSMSPPHFPHYLPTEYAEQADPGSVELPGNLKDTFDRKPEWHAKPWWPSMDTSGFEEDEWRRIVAFSHLHITLVDEAIGRILGAVEAGQLSDSTTVVFCADHGDMCGGHGCFDKGAYFYDEVWRVPLVVRSPGLGPAQQDAFVSVLDIGETLFRAIGVEAAPQKPRAGRDLSPLVGTGVRPDGWPQEAFGAYDFYNGMSFAIRAIRTETHKYVWNPQGIDELYDLRDDPGEMVNLAGEAALARTQGRLRRRLLEWLEDIGDDLPGRTEELPPAGTITATGAMGP